MASTDLSQKTSVQTEETGSTNADWERRIKTWFIDAKNFHDQLLPYQNVAEQYYLGDQTMRVRVPRYMSDAVDNVIFRDVETLVPMITARLPEFVAIPTEEAEVMASEAENVQRVLTEVFRNEHVQKKMEMAARQMLVRRFGVLKVRWDKDTNMPRIHFVDNRKIFMPRFGQTVTDLPYLFELHEFTKDEWDDNFGDGKREAMAVAKNAQPQVTDQGFLEAGKPKNLYRVLELWTNEEHIWCQLDGSIIRREPNPLLAAELPGIEDLKKPYVFISAFEMTGNLIGDTSATEQAMPLQDIVNVVTRQVANNASRMSNGTWLVDSSVMTEEKAKSALNNAPGLIVWGQGAANPNMVRRDMPPAIPEYLLALRQDAKNAIDTIFGTNSTTRGERSGPETKAGRIILREADVARADIYVRPITKAVEDLGNIIVMYLAAYFTDTQDIPIVDEDGTMHTIGNFSAQTIKDNVKRIKVIAGDTLPKDPVNEHNQVMDAFKMGLLDQMSALEKTKLVPNPREVVERSIAIKLGQVPTEFGQGAGMPPQAPPMPPMPPGATLGGEPPLPTL